MSTTASILTLLAALVNLGRAIITRISLPSARHQAHRGQRGRAIKGVL